jgi:hypothetical protein
MVAGSGCGVLAMESHNTSLAPLGGGSVRGPIRQIFSWALLSDDDFWFVIDLSSTTFLESLFFLLGYHYSNGTSFSQFGRFFNGSRSFNTRHCEELLFSYTAISPFSL